MSFSQKSSEVCSRTSKSARSLIVCFVLFLFVVSSVSAVVEEVSYYYMGGSLVASEDSAGLQYHVEDRLGNNRVSFSDEGEVLGEFLSLPFGQVVLSGENRFSFIGKEQDGSGLYALGARYLDPDTGRFTQVDPVLSQPGYQYVGNNPMNYVDPTGLFPQAAIANMFANYHMYNHNLNNMQGLMLFASGGGSHSFVGQSAINTHGGFLGISRQYYGAQFGSGGVGWVFLNFLGTGVMVSPEISYTLSRHDSATPGLLGRNDEKNRQGIWGTGVNLRYRGLRVLFSTDRTSGSFMQEEVVHGYRDGQLTESVSKNELETIEGSTRAQITYDLANVRLLLSHEQSSSSLEGHSSVDRKRFDVQALLMTDRSSRIQLGFSGDFMGKNHLSLGVSFEPKLNLWPEPVVLGKKVFVIRPIVFIEATYGMQDSDFLLRGTVSFRFNRGRNPTN